MYRKRTEECWEYIKKKQGSLSTQRLENVNQTQAMTVTNPVIDAFPQKFVLS